MDQVFAVARRVTLYHLGKEAGINFMNGCICVKPLAATPPAVCFGTSDNKVLSPSSSAQEVGIGRGYATCGTESPSCEVNSGV